MDIQEVEDEQPGHGLSLENSCTWLPPKGAQSVNLRGQRCHSVHPVPSHPVPGSRVFLWADLPAIFSSGGQPCWGRVSRWRELAASALGTACPEPRAANLVKRRQRWLSSAALGTSVRALPALGGHLSALRITVFPACPILSPATGNTNSGCVCVCVTCVIGDFRSCL